MMCLTFRRACVFAIAIFALSPVGPVFAQAVPVKLRPVDRGWVARVQDALGAIGTLQARFRQIAPDGKESSGSVTLDRPGRLRFDYDAPSPLLLVANDGHVVFQDRSVDQVTVIPLARTPLGLLLRPDLKLSGDVTVTKFAHAGGLLHVTLERTDNPGEGSLTLLLSDAPVTLLGWTVVDAQGRATTIALSEVRLGGAVPPDRFVLPKAD